MQLPLRGDCGNIVDATGTVIGETRKVDDADILARIVNQAEDYYYALGGAVFILGSAMLRDLKQADLTPEQRESMTVILDFMEHPKRWLCGQENDMRYIRALAQLNKNEFHVDALWNVKDILHEDEA